jgi:hypothetical protein
MSGPGRPRQIEGHVQRKARLQAASILEGRLSLPAPACPVSPDGAHHTLTVIPLGLDQRSRRAGPLRYVGVPPSTGRAKLGRLCEGVGNLSAWPTRDRGGTIYCGLAVIPAVVEGNCSTDRNRC